MKKVKKQKTFDTSESLEDVSKRRGTKERIVEKRQNWMDYLQVEEEEDLVEGEAIDEREAVDENAAER